MKTNIGSFKQYYNFLNSVHQVLEAYITNLSWNPIFAIPSEFETFEEEIITEDA